MKARPQMTRSEDDISLAISRASWAWHNPEEVNKKEATKEINQ